MFVALKNHAFRFYLMLTVCISHTGHKYVRTSCHSSDIISGVCGVFFSSPGRSPGRAIALPPESASASTFTLKFFKILYFPDHLIDLVHIWYDDRYSSEILFSNTPTYYLKVKVMDFDISNVKVFGKLIFSKPFNRFCSYLL